MGEAPKFTERQGALKWYKIRVMGHLHTRWMNQVEGLSFSLEVDGTTLLAGPVIDQAALHGLLRKVRDLGVHLISVLEVDSKSA